MASVALAVKQKKSVPVQLLMVRKHGQAATVSTMPAIVLKVVPKHQVASHKGQAGVHQQVVVQLLMFVTIMFVRLAEASLTKELAGHILIATGQMVLVKPEQCLR